jgi:hypothetical protein
MTVVQNTQYALQQILSGRTAADVAQELDIDQDALTKKLRKLPEYQEYRRKQKAEVEALKKKALERVLAGETIVEVARDMGMPRYRVGEWLRRIPKYQEHREQAAISEDLMCPSCGGTMQKQELYFWKCGCGAEWWPAEKTIPENPDEWLVTPLAQHTGTGEALSLMWKLYEEGKSTAEIAEALNEAGHKTPKGAKWQSRYIFKYLKRHGLVKPDRYTEQHAKVLEICREMAGKQDVTCKDIADRLNAVGLRTRRNTPWTMHSVREIIRYTLKLDVKLYGTKGVGIRKIREIKLDDGPHPWRRDEDVRRAKIKARRKK